MPAARPRFRRHHRLLRLRHPGQRRHSPAAGISLVELLVVLVVGSVVLAGAIAMMVSHVRTSSQMAALLRLQDQCGRVQFLLNYEIQQAQRASGGGSALTLDVPGMDAAIRYTVNNGELWRSGPPIDAQGRMENDTPMNALVVRGVQAFTVNVANPLHPTYSLSVRDANGVTYTAVDEGGAQCRVREITRATGS